MLQTMGTQRPTRSAAHGHRHEQVVKELRALIFQGVLGPGTSLNQDDLAARLGVSRMPVREALRTLAVEGLVHFQPNRGAVVNELSRRDMDELYRLRLLLEREATRLSVERMSPERATRLVRSLDELRSVAGPRDERWPSLHDAFHVELYRSADMPRLTAMIVSLRNLVEPYSRMYIRLPQRWQQAQEEHEGIVAAYRRGDAAGAESLLVAHLSSPAQALLDLLP